MTQFARLFSRLTPRQIRGALGIGGGGGLLTAGANLFWLHQDLPAALCTAGASAFVFAVFTVLFLAPPAPKHRL